MTNIFIDTSAFYAALDSLDQNHKTAITFFNKIKDDNRYQLIITNLIFGESLTLIRNKIGIKQSIIFGENLRKGKEVKIIFINEDLEEKAWKIFSKYDDKNFSFVDCTSFAVMKHFSIRKAFAFDKHFKQIGFEVIP